MNREREDAALAVANVLTAEERRRVLDAFTKTNPHWRGAEVADILAELDNADSHFHLTERMYDDYALDFSDDETQCLGHAARAVALAYGYNTVDSAWPRVEEIMFELKGVGPYRLPESDERSRRLPDPDMERARGR